ncbi:MAG: hypothetical protein BGO55_14935 [Sphingobacteriales bacterium 50-39]|nr:suppressor of fused domain protein [Sphingobacteriales bacterium]OJW57573.1 MAG: hypothetical protein BGO55_14935 [Sphingobacteriales bacterium 50-39]
MLKDLNEDQLQLEELMSRISEAGYSAGWMMGLEYELWQILNDGKGSFGRHHVTQEELQQLQFLSEKCGCWVVFDDNTEETAVDLETWKKMFSKNAAKLYVEGLYMHYTSYFSEPGSRLVLGEGPKEKLHEEFYVLEIPPNGKHNMYTYCTVGMSCDRTDDNLIELFVYSPAPSHSLVELMTYCASYHRNGLPLNIHHTVNIGQPWIGGSKCDHGFISLPYLDGPDLEIFQFNGREIHCYWFIPITEKERDYKTEHGCEALEQLFESKQINYLNPNRECLVGAK